MFKLLAIGASLLGAGLIITVTGGIISGEGFTLGAGATYLPVEHSYATTGIDTISFDAENRRVVVTPSETDEITLSYSDSTDDFLVITNVGGVLEVTNTIHWYNHMFMNFGMMNWGIANTVNLGVPAGYSFTMNLSSSNGAISVSDLATIASLDLSTSNGTIDVINVAGLSSVDAVTSNGVINVTNVDCAGDIVLRSSNGNVNLSGVTAPSINAQSSNGRVRGLDVTADDVTFHSSNGNITLEINGQLSEYYVKLSTLNGSLYMDDVKVTQNAYNTSLPDKIDLSTTNGSIYLSFNA